MAAERPIVSTPITDVAEPYGEIVYLGAGADAFVAACDRALAASAEERAARVAGMRAVLARTSWDATATAMAGHLADALARPVATGNASQGDGADAEIENVLTTSPLARPGGVLA